MGGVFSLAALLEKRAEIQAANQTPAGYPACAGCALLEHKVWPERKYSLDYLGLTNWIYCNIEPELCTRHVVGGLNWLRSLVEVALASPPVLG